LEELLDESLRPMNGISWANIEVNKDAQKNRRAPVTPPRSLGYSCHQGNI